MTTHTDDATSLSEAEQKRLKAKKALSTTIRALRAHLLDGLHSETEQTYHPSIADPTRAGLDEAARERRARLEGWIDEQVRALPKKPRCTCQADCKRKCKIECKHNCEHRGLCECSCHRGRTCEWAVARERFRRDAEKQAAYTLLGRVIMLRLLEAAGLHKPAIVTGAWESGGFKDFRELAPGLVRGDRSEGYAYLLQVVFEDLATDLPGMYGPSGVGDLIPVPVDTWRHVVETLDDPELAPCWTDDMTLGWVYQYWNDPEREALDAKLHARGKLEPHEIASKTQMFTERYMVDWLLQNSLGPLWLAICAKNGWTAEVQADGTLDRLEARRAEWRAKRQTGKVTLTELMPLHTATERRWAYYVPQPLPADAAEHAPASVSELKILDPAVGSGHFLVVAFDLLFALYQEEARHRGEADKPEWSARAIVERILADNLHGLDLDPRAIQIAAAALWLKAQQLCPGERLPRVNLVASNLRLGGLPKDDPALVELRRTVEHETGIPAELTDKIVDALRGADHLGSLLRIDQAVKAAIDACETELSRPKGGIHGTQGDLIERTYPSEQQRILIGREEAKSTILDRLEDFLKKHTSGDDLGLRLRGQQLATGVRFVRMLREGSYHLVVGNPPYQGTAKMADASYVQEHYADGKADLYAAFLDRGLQLVRPGGMSALLTMRNWMFIKQYASLRQRLLQNHDLRAIGDFAIGAFDEVPNDVLSVVVSVFHAVPPRTVESVALQPTPPDDRSYDRERTRRKRAATLAGVGRIIFSMQAIQAVPEWPVVYWWSSELLTSYVESPQLGTIAPVRTGLCTSDNVRFLRQVWESLPTNHRWVPYVSGAKGMVWFDPCELRCPWDMNGLEIKAYNELLYSSFSRTVQNEAYYFRKGISYTPIGSEFRVRAHRRESIMGKKGSSVFPDDIPGTVCAMNSARARGIIESLNPGTGFEVGDVNRLALFPIANATEIFATVEHAFGEHESHREPSVEFRRPGPSPWRHVQEWAQCAIDHPEGDSPPEYVADYDPEPPSDHLSYALGVALGRFGPNGEGILDPTKDDLSHALPAGILFLDTTLTTHDLSDGLGHPAAAPLHAAWKQHGQAIAPDDDLRGYLAAGFFDLHRKMYENRPIHWPLSSEKRTFVAWITIHRWAPNTLRLLLADHLVPRLTRLDGELADLRAVRDGGDKKAARAADKRFAQVQKWREELDKFIKDIEQCSEKGPLPESPKCPPREVDARYAPDLDDGVMINSAALWPVLTPQWKDPRKWWRELASAEDKRDYDWSHLAMRYWPSRVDAKCQKDPSMAVAHGCFWKYHPDRAWAWELRLQDEIAPDFLIVEAPYRGDGGDPVHRAEFLATRGAQAVTLLQAELIRRIRKHRRRLAEYHLKYTGLWTAHPEECWKLEHAVMQKQKAPFLLLAADEHVSRATYCATHPKAIGEREKLLRQFAQEDMFSQPADLDDEPDNDAQPDDEPGDDEEDA